MNKWWEASESNRESRSKGFTVLRWWPCHHAAQETPVRGLVFPCKCFYDPHLSCLQFCNCHRCKAFDLTTFCCRTKCIHMVYKVCTLLFCKGDLICSRWIESKTYCFLSESESSSLCCIFYLRHNKKEKG